MLRGDFEKIFSIIRAILRMPKRIKEYIPKSSDYVIIINPRILTKSSFFKFLACVIRNVCVDYVAQNIVLQIENA